MKSNKDFKNEAREALRGNWGKAVVATLILVLVAVILSSPEYYLLLRDEDNDSSLKLVQAFMNIVRFFVYTPLLVGLVNALRLLFINGDNNLPGNTLHLAFSDNYGHLLFVVFCRDFRLCLWFLLLIVPGIIKSFAYAMVPFILKEYPEMDVNDVIDLSNNMMKGHKFDLFWLYLSFIGWAILCILTAGIGFLWLIPYVQTSKAAFYEEVKAEYEAKGSVE